MEHEFDHGHDPSHMVRLARDEEPVPSDRTRKTEMGHNDKTR